MFRFILEYRWIILGVLEVFAWLATFFVFYARYRMKSRRWFRIASALLVLTGVIPQVLLGIVSFGATKEVDLFVIFIILLILYGFTFGKKQVLKMDKWAQRKFSRNPDVSLSTKDEGN